MLTGVTFLYVEEAAFLFMLRQNISFFVMDPSRNNPLIRSRIYKPLGKVRRRLQDLRIPSSHESTSNRPTLDLSHNESIRLAVDCLLSQGLEEYHEMLKAEGEVDFLSDVEKKYILEHGKDNPDDPDNEKEFDCLSESCEWSSNGSADSSTTLEIPQESLKDLKLTDPLKKDQDTEVFVHSETRGAGMKDLLRQFIRKTQIVVAIVTDSFSDPELLLDLLEATRRRNVSVHLLLDELNMSLFVSMWQDLKLNSKNFPKLSVRSVCGQTYCARTGRRLTGQITESFIICDWKEVLTGSYSFTWLSWQVHRSIAVHLKGSSVTAFHQELLRLHSTSQPVDGFVSFITLQQKTHSHGTQKTSRGVSKKKFDQTEKILLWTWNEQAEISDTSEKRGVFCEVQRQELEEKGADREMSKAPIESSLRDLNTNHSAFRNNINSDQPDLGSETLSTQIIHKVTKTPGLMPSQEEPNQPTAKPSLNGPSFLSSQMCLTKGRQLLFSCSTDYTSGLQSKMSFLKASRQDRTPTQFHQFLYHPASTDQGSPLTSVGTYLHPRLMQDAKMFSQSFTNQQQNTPPRQNQTFQIQTAGSRGVGRVHSFSGGGQSSRGTLLERRKSMNERHMANVSFLG